MVRRPDCVSRVLTRLLTFDDSDFSLADQGSSSLAEELPL